MYSDSYLFSPNFRAHVSLSPRSPRGIRFLSHPFPTWLAVDTFSSRRAAPGLLRSSSPFAGWGRSSLSAGVLSRCFQCPFQTTLAVLSGLSPVRFPLSFLDQAPILRRLVGLNDGSRVSSLRSPFQPLLAGIPCQDQSDRLLLPLWHFDRQSPHQGVCFHSSTRRGGISPPRR